ncbi:hypothetical protein Bca52824_094652 [Brassica carinata]|uniref:PORR domain-containing protein n=1 Tax=Brassica carinata TaxID=52824 RepID=A0A8X7P3D5_BRACI|nr:hypothetical protein Bca52824_094652 [Brassica carinata]
MSKSLLCRRCLVSSGIITIQCLKKRMFRESEYVALFPVQWTFVQARHKSGGGFRPKKKVYHRVHELDKAIDLKKKPSLILQLKSMIQAHKHGRVLLRDLEKHVGFVQKWNLMAAIEKYPSIFHVGGGNREPPCVMLTEKAQKIGMRKVRL